MITAVVTKRVLVAAGCLMMLSSSSHAERGVSAANMPVGWQWPPSAEMTAAGERCLGELHFYGVDFVLAKRRPRRKINTPVAVPSMMFAGLRVSKVGGNRVAVMDCELALLFARHAAGLIERGVREVMVSSVYERRRARLAGRTTNMVSRHALGLGVDIRGIVTEHGERLTVLCNYDHPTMQAMERFLEASADIRAVVSPGNERSHRNHVHVSARLAIAQNTDAHVDVATLFPNTRPVRHRRIRSRGPRVCRRHKLAQLF